MSLDGEYGCRRDIRRGSSPLTPLPLSGSVSE